MFKYKTFQKLFLFLLVGLVFSSCYKEPRWTQDNVEDLGSVPIIAEFWATDTVKSGEEISLDIRFWSDEAIKEVVFYPEIDGASMDSIAIPYSEASFSNITITDSLVYKLVAPNVGSDTLNLVVNATVMGENGNKRSTSGFGRWYRNYTKPVSIVVLP